MNTPKDFERKTLVDCHNTTQIHYRHRETGVRITQAWCEDHPARWAVFPRWRSEIGSEIGIGWTNCCAHPDLDHDAIFFERFADAIAYAKTLS